MFYKDSIFDLNKIPVFFLGKLKKIKTQKKAELCNKKYSKIVSQFVKIVAISRITLFHVHPHSFPQSTLKISIFILLTKQKFGVTNQHPFISFSYIKQKSDIYQFGPTQTTNLPYKNHPLNMCIYMWISKYQYTTTSSCYNFLFVFLFFKQYIFISILPTVYTHTHLFIILYYSNMKNESCVDVYVCGVGDCGVDKQINGERRDL